MRGCRRRGPETGFDIWEEATIMYMDLPRLNYAVCLLAAVMKKIRPM